MDVRKALPVFTPFVTTDQELHKAVLPASFAPAPMPAEPAPPRRPHLLSPLSWGLAAAVAAPLLVGGVSAWRAWDSAWQAAEAEVTRTAEAGAEYARRLLEGQVLKLERSQELLAGLTDAEILARQPELHTALAQVATEREPAEQAAFYIFAYARDGAPLVASNLLPAPSPDSVIAARDFNQALRGDNPPWAFVSQVYVGRNTQRPYFSVVQRRRGSGNGLPAGAYDGVIAAAIYLDHANAALTSLASGPEARVALLRADGVLLARSDGFGGHAPETLRLSQDSPILAAMLRGEVEILDASPRITALRRVGGDWPVYAAAVRDRATVVTAWRRVVVPQLLLAFGSSLLLLLLARALLRRQHALEAANLALERRVEERTRDLRGRESLLRLAQQAAGAAAWSWQPDGESLHWSPEMFALLGLSPEHDAAQATLEGFMSVVHPEDRPPLRSALISALAEGSMSVEFRVFRRVPASRRDVIWLLCRARLYPAEAGMPATLVGINIDITERRRAEARFEAATAAMAGFVYEWDMATGKVERTAGANQLLGDAAGLSGADWLARMHPEDRERVVAELRRLDRDRASDSYAFEYRLRRADGGWAWLWDRGRVTRDAASGAVAWMIGGAVDVTARRLAEERQFLLLREVDHRAKNALAVVKAALRLTPRDDAAAFATAVDGRIDALARAQALLSETSWSGTPLRQILESTLEAFIGTPDGQAPRVTMEGPELVLAAGAIQPLAMAVHELATNATKYGALSCPGGRLALAWRLHEQTLELTWSERGGPELPLTPRQRGFGSRVVDATLRSQLGGTVEWHWEHEGLRLTLTMPAARVLVGSAGLPL
jgi:PAS domain S-box-containing protein